MRKIGNKKTLQGREIISEAMIALEKENGLSLELKKAFTSLVEFSSILLNHLGVSSTNSSLPPSKDPYRIKKTSNATGKKRKPGGQKGHSGNYLKPVAEPNEIEQIFVDKSSLPPGIYTQAGFEKRQEFNVSVSVHVKEYQAEILVNKKGEEFVADFPKGIDHLTQYGSTVKATSVYLSQAQLIPLDRVRDCFHDQFNLPLSKGSVSNFNLAAYKKLEYFEEWAQLQLFMSPSINADETGINIGGKQHWLHCLSTSLLTLFHPDKNRGTEAMDRMGILPEYEGKVIHDHWKPYFKYLSCIHSLCNAHHLRELERAFEQDNQKWAKQMQKLLLQIKTATDLAGGCLSKKKAIKFRKKYRRLLARAQKECPANLKSRAQSKSRNLLERLIKFEDETLRFMEDFDISFTNNVAENDQRMTKVQQKISGCFRTMEGAKIFCRIRSYLITCRKNGVGATEALNLLFEDKLPKFMENFTQP